MAGANTTEFNNGLPSPYSSEDNRAESSAQDQSAPLPTAHAYPRGYSGYPDHRFLQPVATMASHNPSIAAQSPTQYAYAAAQPAMYASDHGQHYGHAMHYQQSQPRPDWAGYSGHATPITPNHHVGFHQATPTHPRQGNQVFSFVPIPGSQQHKRPRRRYEEIERMYKCGWNGCEKAYGTLNHLNAHVTMQSHGIKRVPEEFKEIRKEWKAKKKAEEAQRKQQEDQVRGEGAPAAEAQEPQRSYPTSRNLPAPSQMSYNGFPTEPQYSGGTTGDFSNNNYMAASAPSQFSPTYAQSHNAVYGHGQQANGGHTH